MIMKDYREVIQNKRKKLGWSQYKLAKKVGIAQSFMNEIEKGRKSPSLEVFFPNLRGFGHSTVSR